MGKLKDEESSMGDGEVTRSLTRNEPLEEEWKTVGEEGQKHQHRLKGREYAIQPHTHACEPSSDIGDCYKGANDSLWKITSPGPYLKRIKASAHLPEVQYLGHWMEITASPPKWKWMRHHVDDRTARASRTEACVLDYHGGSWKSTQRCCRPDKLRQVLETDPATDGSEFHVRLTIVEDLSRDVVEVLRSFYDIPPEFFRGHLDDYLFCKPEEPWVQTWKPTDGSAEFFNVQYLRSRYYKDGHNFLKAELDSGTWNVLRRIDSYESRRHFQRAEPDMDAPSVGLLRSKISFWVREDQQARSRTAILLVDPTPSHGHELWNGPMASMKVETKRSTDARSQTKRPPLHSTLFEQIVYLQSNLDPQDLDPKSEWFRTKVLLYPTLKHTFAHWLLTVQYMSASLSGLEKVFEKSMLRNKDGDEPEDFDKLRQNAGLWRRTIGYYQDMLSDTRENLFEGPGGFRIGGCEPGQALEKDIRKAERRLQDIAQRLERFQDMARTHTSIEESRRSAKEYQMNSGAARLTLLATVFLPLSFSTSFLSMSSDFSVHNSTFRLFFVISGVVLLAVLAWLTWTSRKQWTPKMKSWWRKYRQREEKNLV